MKPTVADTTFLSNFALIRRPELPELAFPGIVMPTAVREEIANGVQAGKVPPCDWRSIPVVESTASELAIASRLSKSLHEGEIACIALAIRLDAIVVTDDRDARQAALALGLGISGTLGALCNLVELIHMDVEEADRLLSEMRSRGYYSPARSIRKLIGS